MIEVKFVAVRRGRVGAELDSDDGGKGVVDSSGGGECPSEEVDGSSVGRDSYGSDIFRAWRQEPRVEEKTQRSF